MGLSLWLVPANDDEVRIVDTEMKALREANATTCSAPFPPHVTLVAGLKEEQGWSAEKTWQAFERSLAQWRRESGARGPLECSLEAVTTRAMYFQCILVALEKTPSLASLNALLRTTYSLDGQPAYFPHCSLLYAPLSREEALEQIEDMHRRGVYEETTSGHIALGSKPSQMRSMTLGAVQLWDANGPVEAWKKLASMEL